MRKIMFFAIAGGLCLLNFGGFAATKQQSVSAGTKVSAATENKAIPKDCQDTFYGCMDAFCMLDNAAGGRCQCSDRITELDQALEDIMKLDEQTYLMATEGVELIQMGEAESQVVARAKAAADKVVTTEAAKKKKTSRTLDLSAWNSVAMIDTDDDVFGGFEDNSVDVASFANKKGDSLYTASAKMCKSQLDDYCSAYGSMLQLVYAQKVKSDCVAYENSLKIQKNQSQQKLQTAQKALRDAALDEYQNQNKYATVGECAVAFAQCMQTTAGCGNDYTGCVTLAAAENVRNDKSGARAKQTKIKGAISGADVTLAASTMNQLLAKKPICESVTKQCVNSNKNDAVWTTFLRNAAPALKSAELVAEQKLRSDCIPTAAECFKTACRSQFLNDDESYDMCLSNPNTYKSLCKVQLEPCLEATGGTYDNPTASTMWNGLVAMLNAMKVDACTAEIKTCLTDRCGSDYSECIGLDVNSIGNLCPAAKLTACMDKYNEETVAEYVADIAQGLAVQIDNALVTACQNAADNAMVRVCGDTQTCESAQFDMSSLSYMIKPMACRYNNESGTNRTCYPNVAQFKDEKNGYGIYATLTGKPAISSITYGGDEEAADKFTSNATSYETTEFDERATEQVVKILNGALNRIMASIEADPRVQYCLSGRSVQGFSGFSGIATNGGYTHFPNLVKTMRATVADYLLSLLYEKNAELEESFEDALDDLNDKINERLSDTDLAGASALSGDETTQMTEEQLAAEAQKDTKNENRCTCDKTPHSATDKPSSDCLTATDIWRYARKQKSDGTYEYMTNKNYLGSRKEVTDAIGTYDEDTNICTIQTIKYRCVDWKTRYGGRCKEYDSGQVVSTRYVNMSTASGGTSSSNSDVVNSGKMKR